MEVHLTPETGERLKNMSAQSGRGMDDLVEDAIAGYLEETLPLRELLDKRYDDLKSGKLKPIPGEEVEIYFHEKSAAARRSQRQS